MAIQTGDNVTDSDIPLGEVKQIVEPPGQTPGPKTAILCYEDPDGTKRPLDVQSVL